MSTGCTAQEHRTPIICATIGRAPEAMALSMPTATVTSLGRPWLTDVKVSTIRAFLRAEHEYALQRYNRNMGYESIRAMINPALFSTLSDMGTLFDCPIVNLESVDGISPLDTSTHGESAAHQISTIQPYSWAVLYDI